jgi:hypothetical protein
MKLKTKLFALAALVSSNVVFAQSNCVKVDQIAKWEVLDYNKTVIYDSQGSTIAFVIFNISSVSAYLKKSGETFRFFSSTLCRVDRVQVSGGMITVLDIEPIRK